MTASRADRFKVLCRRAAKRLGTKISDDRCQHYAVLLLAREQVAAKLIAGRDIDPSALLKLDESLRAFMPVEVPNIQIAFVRPLHEHCRKCGKSQEFICRACGHHEMAGEDANKRPPEPRTAKPDAKPEAPSEPSAPSADNIVPIRHSTHDQPGSLARSSQDTLMGGFKPPGA
jgi:hypothetical protein